MSTRKSFRSLWIALLLCIPAVMPLKGQIVEPVTWSYSVKQLNDTIAELHFKAMLEPTWHMYSQRKVEGDGPNPTEFKFEPSEYYSRIDTVIELTKPIEELDKMFNMVLAYFAVEADFVQTIRVLTDKPFKVTGTIDYQICDDNSCSLDDEDFSFSIGAPAVSESKPDVAAIQPADEQSDKGSGNLWSLFWIAFGSGLIALLTPCVFPMIPMTVSFFMHGKKSRRRSLFEAFFFGASIVGIFAVIGTIVAIVFGPGIANFLSTHWIPNVLFFLIFMFFAAWFFGMFEITLPNWMISKSDQQADKGGIGGPFFMAFTTVLVSFSCTGPIVGTVLVQSAGGEVLRPIIGMLGFGLAFALPFTLFAIFPSWLTSLPKSGGWLNSVKVILGFIELALGLKFLSVADQTYHWGILDREVYLAFWIVIFTLMGFYLLGKIRFKHDSETTHVGVPRLLLAIITFSFVVYLLPGMIGAPLKALAGYLPPETTNDFDLRQVIRENASAPATISLATTGSSTALCEKPHYADRLKLPHGLEGYFDFDQALACAKAQGKPVFVDFTGHGCVNCREMEARVWADPRVLGRLRDKYVVVALYVDDKVIKLPESQWVTSSYDGKVKKTLGKKYQDFQITRFGQNTQPQYALLDTNGELLVPTRSYNLDIDAFIDFLDKGLEEFARRK